MTVDELLVSVGFKFTGQAGLESFRQAIANLEKDLKPLAASLTQVGTLTAAFANQAAASANASMAATNGATAQAAALNQTAQAALDAAAAYEKLTAASKDAPPGTPVVPPPAAPPGTPVVPPPAAPPSTPRPADDDDDAKKKKKLSSALKENVRDVKAAAKELAKMAVVAYGAATAVGAFVLKISRANDELALASQNLKISGSELAAWSGAAKLVLGASADMIESLEKLQMTAVNARMEGGQAAAAFASLGVQTHDFTGNLKSSNEIMMGIIDGLDRLPDRQMKLWRLNQLGLAHMLPFFEKGRAAIEAMMQEQKEFGPTPDQLSKTREFMMLFQRFGLYVQYLANIFVEELQPVFGDMMKDFIAWVKLNKDLLAIKIKEFVQGLAFALKILVGLLKLGYFFFMEFSNAVGGVDYAVKLLTLAFLGFAAVLAGSMVVNIIKIIGHLWQFARVSGVLTKGLQLLRATGVHIRAFFAWFTAGSIGATIAAIGFFVASMYNLYRVLTGQKSGMDFLADWFPDFTAGLRGVIEVVAGLIMIWNNLLKTFAMPWTIGDNFDDVKNIIKAMADTKFTAEVVNAAGQAAAVNPVQLGTAAVQNAQASSAAGLMIAQQNTNTNRNLSKMEVAVNVTGDARGLDVAQLGKILSERLSFEVEQATLNLNSGVTA